MAMIWHISVVQIVKINQFAIKAVLFLIAIIIYQLKKKSSLELENINYIA